MIPTLAGWKVALPHGALYLQIVTCVSVSRQFPVGELAIISGVSFHGTKLALLQALRGVFWVN